MRAVLAAAIVASACSHNVAPAPAVHRDEDPAADPLAFLPADSELVAEIRFRVLEASQLWQSFGPKLTAALQNAMSSRAWADCVWGKIDPLDRTTVAIKGERTIGVLRSSAAREAFSCLRQGVAADGLKVVTDRGVVVAYTGRGAMAFALVGPNTIVFDVDRVASHDSLSALVASGAPLRGVRRFAEKHRAVAPEAAFWVISNGNSPLLQAMNAQALDGTIFVTDRLYGDAQLELASIDQATQLAATLKGQTAVAKDLFDELEISAQGTAVRIHITATRIETLITMLLSP